MSRMSEFNSKFGGGARQLRCQGIHSFLHTLIAQSGECKLELAVDSAEHLIGGGGLSLMTELQP